MRFLWQRVEGASLAGESRNEALLVWAGALEWRFSLATEMGLLVDGREKSRLAIHVGAEGAAT